MTHVRDHTLKLEVAGILKDSIFQGDLLVGEQELRRYDADAAGYRYFLIQTPVEQSYPSLNRPGTHAR